MRYKWIIKEAKEITKDFIEVAGSEIIARLLLNRGIDTPDTAKAYLDPNFYTESKSEEIPDLIKARDRIIEAINKKEKITIFGDYDVDGVTSTSCLLITLKQFTENIDFYIPSRLTEGYGLNLEAVKVMAKKHKTKLLITCDCGITNHKEIEMANELGMDVIVTDHHSLPEILPPAHAVLNPKLLPPDHKLHWLPGVGVAYKLAEAVLDSLIIARRFEESTKQSHKHFNDHEIASPEPALSEANVARNDMILKDDLLDLVALGMIADLAPLVDENRYLVQIGLIKLAKTKKVGLQELLKMCGVGKETGRGGEGENGRGPNVEHIGFGIAPRINAVGRLTDAALAVRLLTTDDLLEAVQIALELETQNKERQFICEETLKEALLLVSEQVDVKKDKCIILAKENWHHGVIGIVASRVVEKFHLPTILIAIDKEQNIARGSGRSIEQLNIVEALTNNSAHLEKYGGHKAACGLSIKPEKINNFIFDFKNFVGEKLASENIEAVINIDLELPLENLNLDLLEKIYKLSPFGLGNKLPVFVSNEVEITGIRVIGKNGQHLKLTLHDTRTFQALIWNHDSKTQFNIRDKIKIVYTPKLNHFNGETFIQLEIKDWQLGRPGEAGSGRVGEKNIVEIYDFRGKTQECLDLLSSQEESIVYFAETEQKNYLPLKTNSRNNMSKAKKLVFLEAPPDENTFIEIIKSSGAEKIYLAFTFHLPLSTDAPLGRLYHFPFSTSHLLKNLTGLLKYTVSNKNSNVTETELQSALGINKTALAFALETLVKIGFLTYKKDIDTLSVNISNPSRQNFNDLIEYNLLTSELKQITKFKMWLYENDLTEVIKMLDKNNIRVTVAKAETKEAVF